MSRIAELILARGDARARGQAESGRIWGDAARGVGQTFAQMLAQYPEQRAKRLEEQRAAKEEQELAEAFEQGMPDPGRLIRILGPERGARLAAGLAALRPDPATDFQKKQTILRDVFLGFAALPEGVRAKYYADVRGNLISRGVVGEQDVPPEYSPEWWQQTIGYGQTQKEPAKVGTREVKTRNADGSESIRIVEDTPGFTATSAAPPPTPKPPAAPGSEEDFIKRAATEMGKTVEQLTAAQLASIKRRFAQATRFEAPKTDSLDTQTEWAIPPGETDARLMTKAEIRAAGARRVPSAAESQDERKFKQADPILRAVTELSEKINTQQGLIAKMSGGVEQVKAQANYNDDVAEYKALVSGFTPLVARALGHTGVLTQQDVDSVKALFPKPGDSKSLRDRKVKRIKSIIGELEGGAAPEADWTDAGGGFGLRERPR